MTDPSESEVRKAVDAAERVVAICDVLAELTVSGWEQFATDTGAQWAVEMGLIRIGETVNRIPSTVLTAFPDQPWRQIIGMRNFAVHQYEDLEPRRVWRTVTHDVPTLRQYLVTTLIPQAGT